MNNNALKLRDIRYCGRVRRFGWKQFHLKQGTIAVADDRLNVQQATRNEMIVTTSDLIG
jgi:hypothetical protein